MERLASTEYDEFRQTEHNRENVNTRMTYPTKKRGGESRGTHRESSERNNKRVNEDKRQLGAGGRVQSATQPAIQSVSGSTTGGLCGYWG